MIALSLPILLLTAPQDASARVKLTLENGATVVVENMPSARTLSVQLFFSFRGIPELRERHGWRHLLEHLIVKGTSGTLDRRLEAQGMLLQADTYRDAMRIRLDGPPARLTEALSALGEVLSATDFSESAIRREVSIIEEEAALTTDARKLSAAAWAHSFGDAGADPIGSVEGLRSATAAALRSLASEMIVGARAVLAIAGPMEPHAASALASAAVSRLPKGERLAAPRRLEAKRGAVEARGCLGEARAAILRSVSDPEAAWALAAALAIASEMDDVFVSYTPSLEPGLLIVGQQGTRGFGSKADELIRDADVRMFSAGKSLAERWVRGYLEEPAGAAFLRGYLLAQSVSARPEDLLDNVLAMTLSEFRKGMDLFREGNAISVIGRGD